jgi:CubicO group peptidase (beta-lactamase class C family)
VLSEWLGRQVEAGAFPGAVLLLGRDEAETCAAGVAAVGGGAMPDDAIMRIQSMTKPVTTVAALRLVEAGQLDLDSGVEQWLPELADRRVLVHPAAELDDTVPADRAITLRHLLTNTSRYGMVPTDTPLRQAMEVNGTEAGADPPSMGAGEWLARLAELPLAFPPGEGWRYHHSFAVLGILIARVTDRPLGDHLAADFFGPLGMADTALWVPEDKLDRLPAAYRHTDDGLLELEPAGGGFYAGPPPFDVAHGELVSTVGDFHRFLQALAGGGLPDGRPLISAEHRRLMTSDQVPDAHKTDDDFYTGFWSEMGWGFGVGVQITGARSGRYGWSGGAGTDFFVHPDGTVGILFTQVELGERIFGVIEEFQDLPDRLAGQPG